MDNENQNKTGINQEPQAPAMVATPQPAQKKEQPKKKTVVYVFSVVLALIIGGVGYFGYTNPHMFRASVLETGVPTVPAATYLYIPNYDASPKDSGNISIKTYNTPLAEDIVSMQFKIKYSPVNALTFNENSIVFDGTTLFKSADLKNINTDTPGEVSVTFFSNTVAQITGNNQTLLKLAVDVNGTPGSSIGLYVSDVEVIKATAKVPATVPPTYNYSASTQFTSIAADKINLVSQAKLRVLNAQALDSTHVLVRFSDLLKSVGPPTEYTSAGITVSAAVTGYGDVTYTGYDQSTVILTTSAQTAGQPYTLQIGSNNFIMGNTKGFPDPNYSKAFFEGYKNPDGVTNSAVTLSSIDVKSSTEVVLNFSGALQAGSVTPINIIVTDTSGASLTVSNAVLTGSNVVTLTTAKQTADANYFVRLNGVKDTVSTGLPLVNNRLQNFFGFSVPSMSISSLKPNSVTNNADQVVVVVGQNLDTVAEVRIGTTNAVISNQTAGAMNFTVPKDFAAGNYDVTFINKTSDTKILDKALTVNAPTVQMRIISEQSKAIPLKVAPDGKTKVTFWVLVEDPVGLANIDSVTMDLEQIGGVRAQEMTKDTGLQQKNQQFYTYTTTVSTTTTTKKDAYKIPVEVRKGGEVAKGTVDITVTNDVTASVPPTVDQVYVNPSTVPPDGKTKVKISAKVSDQDGADKIKSVVADMGALGAGFVPLTVIDVSGGANEQITGWYESAEFTVPTTTKEGSYKVTVTASNITGDTGTADLNLTVSSSVTGPKIDSANSYISPRKSIQKDGKTTFSLNAMVTDPDGVGDIDGVTAYFSTLGLKPATLLKDPNASDAGKTALFSSQDLTVPTTAPLGVHEIQIVATDKSGGTASLILQLDVTYKDTVGDAPIIFSTKSYISPKVAVNDGQTAVTLYTFVRDDDDNLESVVVNLSQIGQVGPEALPDLGGAVQANAVATTDTSECSTNSVSIVCMQASYKEGSDGQWFVLPNVTVSANTQPSSVPYKAEVIATDKTGNVSRGEIPVFVQSSAGYAETKNPPQILAAVATAPDKIEVVFSKELSALTVSSSGSDFTITDKNDTSAKLNVTGAAINADGNLVTLVTDSQTEGKDYVLNAGNNIKDQAGNTLVAGKASRVDFKGFEPSTKQPSLYIVSGTDPETVYLEFQGNLKPSDVKAGKGLSDYDVQVYESDNQSNMLEIKDVEFSDSGNALEVTTSQQKSGQKYIVQIKNISSAAGVQLKSPIAKIFKAVKVSAMKQAAVANQADLNGDGKVDFIDFTMFSAVYGKVFGDAMAGAEPQASGPSPIVAPPDSTIPHTSEPAGGAIPAENN